LLAALLQGNVELALATVPLAGALLGFLRYNFNPPPSFWAIPEVFWLGFLLDAMGSFGARSPQTILGMTAPLMAARHSLLDTSLAIVRRFLHNQPIFGADRGHIHHRLLDVVDSAEVTLLLYACCAAGAILLALHGEFEGLRDCHHCLLRLPPGSGFSISVMWNSRPSPAACLWKGLSAAAKCTNRASGPSNSKSPGAQLRRKLLGSHQGCGKGFGFEQVRMQLCGGYSRTRPWRRTLPAGQYNLPLRNRLDRIDPALLI